MLHPFGRKPFLQVEDKFEIPRFSIEERRDEVEELYRVMHYGSWWEREDFALRYGVNLLDYGKNLTMHDRGEFVLQVVVLLGLKANRDPRKDPDVYHEATGAGYELKTRRQHLKTYSINAGLTHEIIQRLRCTSWIFAECKGRFVTRVFGVSPGGLHMWLDEEERKIIGSAKEKRSSHLPVERLCGKEHRLVEDGDLMALQAPWKSRGQGILSPEPAAEVSLFGEEV